MDDEEGENNKEEKIEADQMEEKIDDIEEAEEEEPVKMDEEKVCNTKFPVLLYQLIIQLSLDVQFCTLPC